MIWLDLTVGIFDELSHPSSTLKAHPGETEALMEWLDIRRIPAARSRARIEWSGSEAMGSDSERCITSSLVLQCECGDDACW